MRFPRPFLLLTAGLVVLGASAPGLAAREVQSCFGNAPTDLTCTLTGQTDVDWVFGVFFEPRPFLGFVTVTVDGSNGGHEKWMCMPYGPDTVLCSQQEAGAKALGTVTVRLDAALGSVPPIGQLPTPAPTAVGPWQLFLYLY